MKTWDCMPCVPPPPHTIRPPNVEETSHTFSLQSKTSSHLSHDAALWGTYVKVAGDLIGKLLGLHQKPV